MRPVVLGCWRPVGLLLCPENAGGLWGWTAMPVVPSPQVLPRSVFSLVSPRHDFPKESCASRATVFSAQKEVDFPRRPLAWRDLDARASQSPPGPSFCCLRGEQARPLPCGRESQAPAPGAGWARKRVARALLSLPRGNLARCLLGWDTAPARVRACLRMLPPHSRTPEQQHRPLWGSFTILILRSLLPGPCGWGAHARQLPGPGHCSAAALETGRQVWGRGSFRLSEVVAAEASEDLLAGSTELSFGQNWGG